MESIINKNECCGAKLPIDVIIDTDIGTDVDDAYALLFALSSPEINVKGITLVHADLETRERITLKLLKLFGRTDIPVAKGLSHPLKADRPIYWGGHEGRGLDFSDVENLHAISEHAPEFIARIAAENPGKITLITIGPMTNAAAAIGMFPNEMRCLKGIVSMASTFNGFGQENAGIEHNVRLDPEACAVVLGFGLPVTIVGLNVTLKTSLTREHLAAIEAADTDLSQFFFHMTSEWLNITGRDYAIMHDALGVAAAFEPKVVELIPVSAAVSTDIAGLITYEKANETSLIRVAKSVDIELFNSLFHPRILSAMKSI
ncbi:MAG: nucleoside hydrolase [Armatimonadota bacterium]|nr:nucleoside hydrolase [Armatimonadota bacterium]